MFFQSDGNSGWLPITPQLIISVSFDLNMTALSETLIYSSPLLGETFFGSDSTDCCTWKVALEAKPDETPNASPLYCKSFNTTSWLQRPKLFLLSMVFCASSHMCCLLNITYANRGSIILYPQTTFSQILGPRLQTSTVNIKRASACTGERLNIQAGLTLMAPPFTREIIVLFLLLCSGQ